VPEYLKRAAAPFSTAAGRPRRGQGRPARSSPTSATRDVAVRQYSESLTGVSADFASHRTRSSGSRPGRPRVLDDIRTVQRNVRDFAGHQRDSLTDFEVEAQPGVFLASAASRSLGRGLRTGAAPAGGLGPHDGRRPPPSPASRTSSPTPPIRGEIPATTVAAMHLAGATDILLLGGCRPSPARGRDRDHREGRSHRRPGNAYVAEAKRQLFG